MGTKKKTQPAGRRLDVKITEDMWETAVQSDSGSCLIADAVKAQYPELSHVTVDMVTIRATDRKRGVRYTYLTPPEAQELLLFFDQGWSKPSAMDVRLWQPVHVKRITKPKGGPGSAKAIAARRAQRATELEAKKAAGDKLTPAETRSLARTKVPIVDRPSEKGAATVVEHPGHKPTIVGGNPPRQGVKKENPNLLRGTNRHFGVKQAEPGQVFKQAVEAAVAERVSGQTEIPI